MCRLSVWPHEAAARKCEREEYKVRFVVVEQLLLTISLAGGWAVTAAALCQHKLFHDTMMTQPVGVRVNESPYAEQRSLGHRLVL